MSVDEPALTSGMETKMSAARDVENTVMRVMKRIGLGNHDTLRLWGTQRFMRYRKWTSVAFLPDPSDPAKAAKSVLKTGCEGNGLGTD